MFAVASIVNFGAFGFAPAAVLAPLESIQFVSSQYIVGSKYGGLIRTVTAAFLRSIPSGEKASGAASIQRTPPHET